MTLTVLLVILSVFAILGITEFLHSIFYSFLSVKNNKTATVVYLTAEKALAQLRFVTFERNWFGDGYSNIIVAVYDNLSFETLEICKEFIGDKDIVLVPIEYVKNVLESVL